MSIRLSTDSQENMELIDAGIVTSYASNVIKLKTLGFISDSTHTLYHEAHKTLLAHFSYKHV